MSILNKAILIFLLKLLIISNMTIISESFKFPAQVNVTIVNNLQSQLDLSLHCKSADDDLGAHVLSYLAEFSFHFKMRFIGATRFYCHFAWQGDDEWFDVFLQTRDACSHCIWNIRETGPCLEKQCFPWNH